MVLRKTFMDWKEGRMGADINKLLWIITSIAAKYFTFKKTFYFVLGCNRLANNVVIVSGEQRRDSAIYMHVSTLPQTSSSRLTQNIEQSSMCYTVGLCWLSILNIAVCTNELTYRTYAHRFRK